jgi:hypothetical protein
MSIQLFEWNTYDYAAVCIVPTPSIDASGIAHLVEHLVFRYSDQYPAGHELFVANTLLPVKINASTQDDYTLFYVVSADVNVFLACLDYLAHGIDQLDYSEQCVQLERDGVLQRELQWLESHSEYITAATLNRATPSCVHAGGYSDLMPLNSTSDVRLYKQICYAASHRQWLINRKDIAEGEFMFLGAPSLDVIDLASNTLSTTQYDTQKLPEAIQTLLAKALPVSHAQELLESSRQQLDQTLGARHIQPTQVLIQPFNTQSLPIPNECVSNNLSKLAQKCLEHVSVGHIPPLPKFILSQLEKYPELLLGKPYQNIQLKKLNEVDIEEITRAEYWQKRLQGQCYAMGLGYFEDNIYQYIFAQNSATCG